MDKLKEDIREINYNIEMILLGVENEFTVEESIALNSQERRLKEKKKYLKIIEGEKK